MECNKEKFIKFAITQWDPIEERDRVYVFSIASDSNIYRVRDAILGLLVANGWDYSVIKHIIRDPEETYEEEQKLEKDIEKGAAKFTNDMKDPKKAKNFLKKLFRGDFEKD